MLALRWLFLAAFVAWTLAAVCGAMPWVDYAKSVHGTLIIAAFMAAVGLRTSLAAATATRAMAITLGVWLGSYVVVLVLSFIPVVVVSLFVFVTNLATTGTFGPPFWLLSVWPDAWAVTFYALYAVATLLVVADTRLRFDRIAGRMTAGRVARAVDTLIHDDFVDFRSAKVKKSDRFHQPPLTPLRNIESICMSMSHAEKQGPWPPS